MKYSNNKLMQFFNKKEIKTNTFIILLGVFSMLPFLIITFYNHPSSDDFTYVNAVNENGFFNAQISTYLRWSGRYVATFILSLNPILFKSFFVYKLLPIGVMVFLFYGFFHLANSVLELTKKSKIALSFLFLFVFFFSMPSIAEGIYWLPGSATYQFANIYFLFFISFLVLYFNKKKRNYFLLSLLFLVLIIGSNETAMLIVDFVIFIIFSIDFIKNKKINKNLLILLLTAVIFSIISIKAPGNSIRSNTYSVDRTNVIKETYLISKFYFKDWLPLLLLFSVLFIDIIGIKKINKYKVFSINPWLSFSFVICIIFLGFFPTIWSTGTRYPPAPRTINTIFFFFIISWTYFILTLLNKVRINKKNTIFLPKVIRYILFIVTIGIITNKNNILYAYKDLTNNIAKNYNQELNNRYKQIKKATKNTILAVPKLKNKPKTIFFRDITSDKPNNWRNKSFAKYWNIKEITIEP